MVTDNTVRSISRLFLIIPTHNRWFEARITLDCLYKSKYQKFQTLLIDDGSTDRTVEFCKKDFPQIIIISGDGNLWWSGAINRGINFASSKNADAVIWLNDDNRVEPQTITKMIESYQRNGRRSIVCARTKSLMTGKDEWIGNPPRWHSEYEKWSPPDLSLPDVRIEHPPGGRGVLIPMECFRDIGYVDQKSFPHYWADHDFHYRAMKAGYKYYLATEAIVWNVPNTKPGDLKDNFSIGWCLRFLFSRRSPMNLPTLKRLLKRHLNPVEYRKIFYPFVFRTVTWLAIGWAARKPIIHKSLRAIRRTFLTF